MDEDISWNGFVDMMRSGREGMAVREGERAGLVFTC
jgi:hypothetical protein